jgi:type IV secretory pathway TrbD component
MPHGIKVSRFNARERIAVSVLPSLVVLLSVSFGLAAAALHWWIIAPVAAGFALVTWFVGMHNSSARTG